MSLNERIKEVRSTIGLSQAKFANRMAISSSYLADMELSKMEVTERIIRLLCAEYSVNDHWFRTGEGSMFDPNMDAQLSRIISLFKSFNQQFKGCALNQMEELADLYGQLNINQ